MKKYYSFIVISLFFITVCFGCNRCGTHTDDFITVDVTKSYSHKKVLMLHDFMDVEYISLETNDDCDISRSIICKRRAD